MAHWPHSGVNYKSESTRSVLHRYHYCSDEFGALYLPVLSRAVTPFLCAFAPLRLCAFTSLRLCVFAPLRLCEKPPINFRMSRISLFLAKAQRREARKANPKTQVVSFGGG